LEHVSAPAVFLDRDGTINVRPAEHCYVTDVDELEVLPGAVAAIALLQRIGRRVVVVSNQQGVARGVVSAETLRAIEERINAALLAEGAEPIAEWRYCPHRAEDGCDCRKPRPGLLLAAAEDLGLDLPSAWMIGDSLSDVAAGAAAGTHTALVGCADRSAELCVSSLLEAARAIAAQEAKPAISAS
jgi:D-glycero-D-manno-heptose 1,7-bisphosphate phosphatase